MDFPNFHVDVVSVDEVQLRGRLGLGHRLEQSAVVVDVPCVALGPVVLGVSESDVGGSVLASRGGGCRRLF